jgi:sulfatase modifying factor 1
LVSHSETLTMSEFIKSCCVPSRSTEPTQKSNMINPVSHNSLLPSLPEKIYLPGGEFLMGTNGNLGYSSDGEGPERLILINPIYIDIYAVTNEKFEMFVKATSYVTEAERYGWSFVFRDFVSPEVANTAKIHPTTTPWWWVIESAYWRNPEGPKSNIDDRRDHPVVHVSWNDAIQYCNWSGQRLPTEAEWEYAARGGLSQMTYPWGNNLTNNGKYRCNIWQGVFPDHNTQDDGYLGTAPVNSFDPNNYGLYNMVGNIWEWCSDWFSTQHLYGFEQTSNPKESSIAVSKTMKGGSYLCHESYCNRYRIAARSSNTPDSSTGNLGFRCVKDLP